MRKSFDEMTEGERREWFRQMDKRSAGAQLLRREQRLRNRPASAAEKAALAEEITCERERTYLFRRLEALDASYLALAQKMNSVELRLSQEPAVAPLDPCDAARKKTMTDEPMLTFKDIAKHLRLTYSGVHGLFKDVPGVIAIRNGKRTTRRVPVRVYERWLKEREVRSRPRPAVAVRVSEQLRMLAGRGKW